jgi:hypothetical protein
VDELFSKKILEMGWLEFLEAIARMAEKFSPAPYLSDPSV